MPEKKFNNMNDLIEYLSEQEIKIMELEKKVNTLQEGQRLLQQKLSNQKQIKTNLISPNFFKRAFTVWGHFIIANLIIGLPWACYSIYTFLKIFSQIQPIVTMTPNPFGATPEPDFPFPYIKPAP